MSATALLEDTPNGDPAYFIRCVARRIHDNAVIAKAGGIENGPKFGPLPALQMIDAYVGAKRAEFAAMSLDQLVICANLVAIAMDSDVFLPADTPHPDSFFSPEKTRARHKAGLALASA